MRLALTLAAMFILCIAVSGQESPFGNVFQNLSTRAMAVVVTMIGEAQQRGAASIDVNDLIIALIAEDQDERAPLLFVDDMTPEALFYHFPGEQASSAAGREPFFRPKVAVDVLIKLNQILPRSTSNPRGTGMQTSAALDRLLAAASNLPSELNQGLVKLHRTDTRPAGMYQAIVPLDLLAAALREPCEGTKLLQAAGISEEKVLQILRSGDDLENGSFHLDV
jgi:hypothetical protein